MENHKWGKTDIAAVLVLEVKDAADQPKFEIRNAFKPAVRLDSTVPN